LTLNKDCAILLAEFNGLVSNRVGINYMPALLCFYVIMQAMNKKRKIAAKKKRKADGKTVSLRHR
jgi:hypothetical protein